MMPPTSTVVAGMASSTFTSTNSSSAHRLDHGGQSDGDDADRGQYRGRDHGHAGDHADGGRITITRASTTPCKPWLAGQTIRLVGTFDWTEAFAAASWALGSDGVLNTLDDYSILVPDGLNNVTFTADNLGDATIQGPGDLAAVNLEGVFFFNGAGNQNWTISNIRFLDFDLSIGMFNGSGGVTAYNGTQIVNNYIRIARDLNATVAPADVNQNIGIHYSFGTNQLISGNTIDIQGDGVSDGSNFATDVAMQSNTSGGNVYDGLQITNNTVRVLNAQSANPQVILGIWENAHAHSSNITVSGNSVPEHGGREQSGDELAARLPRDLAFVRHHAPWPTRTTSSRARISASNGSPVRTSPATSRCS